MPSGQWTFAYGSNMNLQDLKGWLVSKGYRTDGILQTERATLHGFRLAWNYYSTSRGGGAANIETALGEDLPGLGLKVDKDTLDAIDRKENHPKSYNRGKTQHRIRLRSGKAVRAWVYIASANRSGSGEPVWPTRAYLQLLIEAAEIHGLPEDHITRLKQTPICDP